MAIASPMFEDFACRERSLAWLPNWPALVPATSADEAEGRRGVVVENSIRLEGG